MPSIIPQSRFIVLGYLCILMASCTLLLQQPVSEVLTLASSQLMVWPLSITCTAIPFFLSPFFTACLCSEIRFFPFHPHILHHNPGMGPRTPRLSSSQGRTLKKRISEHKQAVKKCDRKNGIAVHVMDKGHTINWEEANVRTSETGYWRRRVQEAIRIQRQPNTMNLDCGMILGNVWTPALRLR